jgi:hypothetical protein
LTAGDAQASDERFWLMVDIHWQRNQNGPVSSHHLTSLPERLAQVFDGDAEDKWQSVTTDSSSFSSRPRKK